MTVKKRLFWSNILMILVPLFVTALIGLLCIFFIWLTLIHGAGIQSYSQDDFERICLAVAETYEHSLNSGREMSSLDPLLDNNKMTVLLVSQGETLYFHGAKDENDEALLSAAAQLEGNATLSQNGRSLFAKNEETDDFRYTIYLFGGNYSETVYGNLKTAFAVSAVLVVLTVFLSVLIANRFLTRFVFRKIESPLDILTSGVHEIRDGNLDFRIRYTQKDEFLPVCEDFNEMAEHLKESVDLVQRQERSRKELLAGISHDIRSPLTSIQAYVEGLLDGVAQTPEAQRHYLMTIKCKAEALDRLVTQLLLYSKMELGEEPYRPCRFRLDRLIEKSVESCREEYRQNGLEIVTLLNPAVVFADPVQMERVISNILGNSLKYKEKPGGFAEIRLVLSEKGCVLTFCDDGPGVPDEALPHLFDAFYRCDPARRNPDRGSGLGLSIVSNIVQRMGGSVCAKTAETGGLEICLELPCVQEQSQQEGTDEV